MKKVLLYGMCGMDNLGDDLMYYSISKFLNSKGYSIEFISRMRWKAYFSKEKVPNCVSLPIYEKNFVWIGQKIYKYAPCIKRFYDGSKFRKLSSYFKSNKYDALFFLGGGYITSNKTVMSVGELENMVLLAQIAKNMGMKVIFSGLTVGPFEKNDRAQQLALQLFSYADSISVREQYSYNELKKMGINALLTGDNIFLSNAESSKKSEHILVNLKYHKEQSINTNNIMPSIVELCKGTIFPVKVISFRSDENSDEYQLNKRFCSMLQAEGIKSEIVIPGTVDELFNLFQKAEFIIGSAYHSVAVALLCRKKIYTWFEGKYYTFKIKGLLDMFGIKNVSKYSKLYESVDKYEFSMETVRKNVQREWEEIVKLID